MSDVMDLAGELFPGVVIELVATRLAMLSTTGGDTVSVVRRPLRAADPNWSAGVYAQDWQPVAGSQEMRGVDFAREPTLQQYVLMVQAMIKDANEERGLLSHSVFSETVRTILATDTPLRQQLGGLEATLNGRRKSLKRWWVRSGRYASGSVGTNNLYLSTNELILEVENVT